MKNLVYIDREEEIPTVLDFLQKNSSDETVCIAGNAVIMKILKEAGIPCSPMLHFHNHNAHDELWETALQWGKTWFKDSKGTDYTEFQGISLGKAFKWQATLFINHSLMAFKNVQNILDQKKPAMVIIVDNSMADRKSKNIFDLDMHKELFKKFSSKSGYRIQTLSMERENIKKNHLEIFDQRNNKRNSFFAGIHFLNCQKAFVKSTKGIIIFLVDLFKTIYLRLIKQDREKVRALVIGATDINYLGSSFIHHLLRSSKRCLYYLEREMNCFTNLQLRHSKIEITSSSKKEIGHFNLRLKDIQKDIRKRTDQDHSFFHDGISLYECCGNYFERLFNQEFLQSVDFIAHAREAIIKNNINIVLLTNCLMARSVILALLAEQQGIPAMHIPHGHNNCYLNNGEFSPFPLLDPRHFPYFQSHETVGLKPNYHFLLKEGVPKKKLALVGMQAFETKEQDPYISRIKAREKLGFGLEDNILLFATTVTASNKDKFLIPIQRQTDSFSSLDFYEDLLSVFPNENKFKLVFKFRPMDILIRPTQEMITSRGFKNTFIFTQHLNDLLLACDAVMVTHSNVGYEALFFEIPIIQYDRPGSPQFILLKHEGAAIDLKDITQLPGLMEKLKSDENYKYERIKAQKQFLKNNLPDDHQNASERIINWIDLLVTKKI